MKNNETKNYSPQNFNTLYARDVLVFLNLGSASSCILHSAHRYNDMHLQCIHAEKFSNI